MCGIFCEIHPPDSDEVLPDPKSLQNLKNRGPDSCKSIKLPGLTFLATLLWQQGASPTVQPLESDQYVLLFNGDCFMEREDPTESDSKWLFDKLHAGGSSVLDLLKSLHGPLSLVLYDKLERKLYFLRDALGRNSLLMGKTGDSRWFLTSVMARPEDERVAAIEVPTLGIFVYDFDNLTLHPWQRIDSHAVYTEQLSEFGYFFGDLRVEQPVTPDWRMSGGDEKITYDFFRESRGVTCDSAEMWFEHFLANDSISKSVDRTIELLRNSVRDRVTNSPELCKSCIRLRTPRCQHARLAVLFSGGLDCSVLALLADQLLDSDAPIDLVNVAFEKAGNPPGAKVNWDVPDRLTARESFQQLRLLSPDREWRLVEVNVTRAELHTHIGHIAHLVYPLTTVLDESIGAALWFAARGHTDAYQTVSRVLLIGSGADELFGGYTRHRNAYTRNNKPNAEPPDLRVLEEELLLDWVRLPSRNLARDDRVIADHGSTPRAPFVEEKFVQFVRQLRAEQRCCHALEAGVGDKLLLRLAAHRLGLSTVAGFRKRALQFGSRIADSRQNAKDRSAML